MSSTPARWFAVVLGVCASACAISSPIPDHQIFVIPPYAGEDAVVLSEGPVCPRPVEWALVTWPEMEPVAAVIGPSMTRDPSPGCLMPIAAEEPLTERWYAAQWHGELREFERTPATPQLLDGSRVWRFRGVTPPLVTTIEMTSWEGHTFLQAHVSEQIEPAPGHEWASLMTVTQGDVECFYPGAEVSEGGASIGFHETIVVECVAVDLGAPVHIHVEGAVGRLGARSAIPIVDLDHTFGISTDSVALVLVDPFGEQPPPCDNPRCE
jgi:hypothetical protein